MFRLYTPWKHIYFLKVDMLQKTMKYIHEHLIWLGGSLNQFTGEKHSILRSVYFTESFY